MALTPKFAQADVTAQFDRFLEAVEKEQVAVLQRLGEEAVLHARELPAEVGFHDQTGNLRSSIGYTVFDHGVAVRDNYHQVLQGAEGVKKGKALAKRVGSKYTKGICLVVTAGMDYALALEANGAFKMKSKRSYVVLSSSEALTKQQFPKRVEELRQNIIKAMNS